jgi:hypothetical protein
MYIIRSTEGLSIEIVAREKHCQIYSKVSRYFVIITAMHMKDITRCNDPTGTTIGLNNTASAIYSYIKSCKKTGGVWSICNTL